MMGNAAGKEAGTSVFVRRETVAVRCKDVIIGGGAPVSIQTMTKTLTYDVSATVEAIESAVSEGADIVRLAVPDEEAARAFAVIREKVKCPLVADIHFDPNLALLALDSGADKIRVNPGNIGGQGHLLRVARAARDKGASIRVGVNSGSLEKDLLAKYGGPVPEAMVESAVRHLKYLEDSGCDGLVVSLKSSKVEDTVRAYNLLAPQTKWPFHIGITEAGPGLSGVVKSACGIGSLLALGLGDTLRVSLTGPSTEEVAVAKEILQAMGKRTFGPELISCPTCGRTQVNLVPIVAEVESRLKAFKAPIKVAVMGCPVNGPGEAREAHVGIACGRQGGILFSHGQVLGRVEEGDMVEALLRLVQVEEEKSRR